MWGKLLTGFNLLVGAHVPPRNSDVPEFLQSALSTEEARRDAHSPISVLNVGRQSTLPPKSEVEARHHAREIQRLQRSVRKKQRQLRQADETKSKQLHSREVFLERATLTWEQEIIPNWDTLRGARRVRKLWAAGLPPKVRGDVWKLAVGNSLNITSDLFHIMKGKAVASRVLREEFCGHAGHASNCRRVSCDAVDPIDCGHQAPLVPPLPLKGFDPVVVGAGPTMNSHRSSTNRSRPNSIVRAHHPEEVLVRPAVFVASPMVSPRTPPSQCLPVAVPSAAPVSPCQSSQLSSPMSSPSRSSASSTSSTSPESTSPTAPLPPADFVLSSSRRPSSSSACDSKGVLPAVSSSPALRRIIEVGQNFSREETATLIALDLARTFPHLQFYREGPYHDELMTVLTSYVQYRPDIGYVQGMSYLAGMLLLYMNAQDAFVSLSNLLNAHHFMGFFRMNPREINVVLYTFMALLAESLPAVYRHFVAEDIVPELYLVDWFVTLFSKSFPLDIAVHIWDLFLLDSTYMYRCAIAVLKHFQSHLVGCSFDDCFYFLTHIPKEIDAFRFFEVVDSIKIAPEKFTAAKAYAVQHAPADFVRDEDTHQFSDDLARR